MSKKSKDLISRSLIELMHNNPYNVITISEICDNTQIVRKTYYNNFLSKQDIISYYCKSLINEYFNCVLINKNEINKDPSNIFFLFGEKHKTELKLLMNNNLYHLFGDEFRAIFPKLQSLFPKRKLFEVKEEELEFIYSFLSAGIIQLLEQWIKTDSQKTINELTKIYFFIIDNIPEALHAKADYQS